jgi:hypothetical protein
VLGALALAACAPGPAARPAPVVESVPERAVPAHARLVVLAAAARLRGESEAAIARRTQVAGAGLLRDAEAFRYNGFAVREVRFLLQPADGEGDHTLHAGLRLEDAAGRAAVTEVLARYAVAGGAIRIQEGGLLPLPPPAPRAEAYLLPVEAVRAGFDRAAATHEGLLRLAMQHGVPAAQARGRDLLAVVILRDRLAPGGVFTARLSETRDGTAGLQDRTRVRTWPGGFVAALVPLRIEAQHAGPLWLKAVYDGAASVPDAARGERLVGLFALGG